MATQLIAPTTSAQNSPAFSVIPADGPRGISAIGLAGAETVTVSRDRGDGTFRPLTDSSAILTATAPESSIVASGKYRLEKTATVAAASAYID